MTAVELLSRVPLLVGRIDALSKELGFWAGMANTVSINYGGDRVRSSGPKSSVSYSVDKCLDAENELRERICELQGTLERVRDYLYSNLSPAEATILHRRYIMGWSLQRIGEDMGRDYSWVTTIHGRARKHLEERLAETGDSVEWGF